MKGDSVDKVAEMLTVVFGISTAIIALAAAILPAVMAFLIDWKCLLLYPALLAFIFWQIRLTDQVPRQ